MFLFPLSLFLSRIPSKLEMTGRVMLITARSIFHEKRALGDSIIRKRTAAVDRHAENVVDFSTHYLIFVYLHVCCS